MNSVTIGSQPAILCDSDLTHDDRALHYHANLIMLESISNVFRSATRLLGFSFGSLVLLEGATHAVLNPHPQAVLIGLNYAVQKYGEPLALTIGAVIVSKLFKERVNYYEKMVQLPSLYNRNSVK